MKDRGYSEQEIDRAGYEAWNEFFSGVEEPGHELPVPQQADTLEIQRQLDEAQAARDTFWDQLTLNP